MKIIGRKIVASIYLGQEILSMPAGKCCVVRILDYQNLSHYDYILAARAGAGEKPPSLARVSNQNIWTSGDWQLSYWPVQC